MTPLIRTTIAHVPRPLPVSHTHTNFLHIYSLKRGEFGVGSLLYPVLHDKSIKEYTKSFFWIRVVKVSKVYTRYILVDHI